MLLELVVAHHSPPELAPGRPGALRRVRGLAGAHRILHSFQVAEIRGPLAGGAGWSRSRRWRCAPSGPARTGCVRHFRSLRGEDGGHDETTRVDAHAHGAGR